MKPTDQKVQPIETQPRSQKYPDGVNGFDVRGVFTHLTRYTTPHGFEWMQHHELLTNAGFTLDKTANYRGVITNPDGSEPETIFIAHLDTVGPVPPQRVEHFLYEDGVIASNGKTILGADDKAGVTVLLYLIHQRVPGLYVMTWGEESGRQGSRALVNKYRFDTYKRAIAFDRKGTSSIITKQSGQTSCSDQFADALIDQFHRRGMIFTKDPGGSYTDTVSFFGEVPECTNISAGYTEAHSNREQQDLAFLEDLCHAAGEIDWEALSTAQDPKKRYSTTPTRVPNYQYGFQPPGPGGFPPKTQDWHHTAGWPAAKGADSGKATKALEHIEKKAKPPEESDSSSIKGAADPKTEPYPFEFAGDDLAEMTTAAQEAWDTMMELLKHSHLDVDTVADFFYFNPEAAADALHSLIVANPHRARQHAVRLDTTVTN